MAYLAVCVLTPFACFTYPFPRMRSSATGSIPRDRGEESPASFALEFYKTNIFQLADIP